ncbi:LacI family DNA-binding transcriptional regulator [Staphylococcus simulans]
MNAIATIKDVAKEAGLSTTTISRFLNHHPYISEVNREKIKAAMEKLNYIPNTAATQLRSNKTYSIGVIVPRITNPYFSYLIESIEKELESTKYRVIIMQTHNSKEEEIQLLNMLRQKAIDGIIMCTLENDISIVENYFQYGPIVVSGNQNLKSDLIPIVATDQETATYEAIDYLISKNYKKIAYCTGGNYTDSNHGSARNLGFQKAMMKHNQKIDNTLIFKNIHTIEDGRNVGQNIIDLDVHARPDAIFAGSDEVAAGLIEILSDNEIAIPDEIAIMGYDNQPFSSMLKVPLTTISQPIKGISEQTTCKLLNLMDSSRHVTKASDLKLRIIERAST